MTQSRRTFLRGTAGLCLAAPIAACESRAETVVSSKEGTAPRAAVKASVYVPGYFPQAAYANGVAVANNRRLSKAVRNQDEPFRMLTRIDMDGQIRQALLPAYAHDVKISPDRRLGVLCGFEERNQVAFDPDTLELVAEAPTFAEGWRGGGHAQFVDGGKTVLLSERAPLATLKPGAPEALFGRITIRDADTLALKGSYSTHGIDPHDIRLIEDGRYLVVANYGSVIKPGETEFSVPRHVVQACVTVIDMTDGRLVDKQVTNRGDAELRHLAAGAQDRIFAIQARLGDDAAGTAAMRSRDAAYRADITSERGMHYLSAATLKCEVGKPPRAMGRKAEQAQMRHGLSIAYDAEHDQAIATFPSADRVMVFDGASGEVVQQIDTTRSGLRYPCGVTLLPDGKHYAVTGYWENLFVYERGSHRLVRDLCLYPMFFGHSHITAA
ncbi:DUF1513 domain-containing protein [Thalassovita taeanensis]|uniref:DUF1513 domain-containing protein n=1 Tax=Thalassovita taeanensis TaxID=657014 RepID=A0A1H9AHB0_9RHOB|nr:DUF1513 domain-containing protein [Thalassovita taeanensis]SEP75985.1 hypothetical protein SAMN04488092_102136 [Thalassovita taeanensis]